MIAFERAEAGRAETSLFHGSAAEKIPPDAVPAPFAEPPPVDEPPPFAAPPPLAAPPPVEPLPGFELQPMRINPNQSAWRMAGIVIVIRQTR